MVTTKHCCFGVCRSDSRYSDREHMKGVFFIPFPKPGREPEKCQRWVRACKREGFTEKNVTKDTYICSLHFLGGKGPTIDDPDPIPATTTSGQVEKIACKRKAPTQRNEAVSEAKRKRKRLTHNNTPSSSHETEHESTDLHINDDTTAATALLDLSSVSDLSAQIITDSFDKMDQSCQTDATCDELIKLKLENKIQKDELSKCREQDVNAQQKSTFSVDDVRNDDKQAKFYTCLTWLQFMALWNFLGPSTDKLTYHKSTLRSEISPSKRPGVKRKLDPINELFLTLIRLRTGLLHQDLAFRFGVSVSLVSKIVTTWIQFMYLEFSTLRKQMFASREIVARNLPSCFKRFKGIRTIIDCTEFFVEQASNFEQQGNLYSSYKSHGTYKVLVGVSPTGAVMFVSDAYEGSISDVEIVKQSGFLDNLEAGDLVLADRGFTIREILAERGVHLNIPPFLSGRKRLTPEEEIYTKKIARVRIHVERCIERIKKFRLLSKVVPLSLQPVFSQMVFVAACLVNFQEPLVT
ncbi:uncharacterized protein LOC121650918 [Melanotaenia boesemani]|uniref:uncharacterized protein LOC121650918 n=1 Tax=Melanotaenia boesemani TaxID=1250792 RepID=UPI001C056AD2|nr:uncharacterized protein LOC121650918 [Melanotaenia boesemani]